MRGTGWWYCMSALGLHVLAAALVVTGLAALVQGPAPAQESPRAPGVAGSPPASGDPASGDIDRLRERAALFWAARLAGDTKAQWELLEPRGRNRMTPAEFAPPPGVVKHLAFQVEDATVDGYFATVNVRLLVQITPPAVQRQQRVQTSSHLVSDKWVRIGGVWYRSLEQEESGPQHSSDQRN
jgi:hypothetical protein